VVAAKLEKPMQDVAAEVLLPVIEAVEQGRLVNLGDPALTEKFSHIPPSETPKVSGSPDANVLNVVTGSKIRWHEEHEALDEILDSGHPVAPEAIKKNLVAFRELVQRARDEKKQPLHAPGSQRISGDDMGRLHEQSRVAVELAKRGKGTRGEHQSGGKRRREPQTGTD
jgi:hypothetical protein